MVEVELKFQLPESKKNRPAIFKNIKHSIFIYRPSITIRQTAYLQNGMALRLRKENDLWVQTFKAAGQSHLHRVEEEVFRKMRTRT